MSVILILALAAALGATDGLTPVELVNNTGDHQLTISMDGRQGCQAGPKGGHCSFAARPGFHHFAVVSRAGDRMEKALYVSADNAFVWTVEGKDLPGGDRWSKASADSRMVCKMQLTNSGIAQTVCASKRDWDAENTRTRQDLMVKQNGFCGGGAAC